MEFCQQSLSYNLNLLLIWSDETLRYNSPDPEKVTLLFAVNTNTTNTTDKVFEKLMESGDEFNVTCCVKGELYSL